MSEYKVKLDDGSEIGPLDMQTLRSWYEGGLVGPDTPALKAGSRKWSKLSLVAPMQEWGPSAGSRRLAKKQRQARLAAEAARAGAGVGEAQPWRVRLGGVLLMVAAAAAAYAAFVPERWHPDLDGAPWRVIGGAALVLGLPLLRGWDIGRRIVRAVMVLASVGVLALGGVLLAREVGINAWLVLLSLWVFVSGMILLLAGSQLRWLHSALALLLVSAGVAGIVRFGWVPESDNERRVREWAAEPAPAASIEQGWSLRLPDGWMALRPGSPLSPSEDARLVLAEPRLRAFAFARVDPIRAAGGDLDGYLDAVVAARREVAPSLEIADRADAEVAGFAALRAMGAWGPEGDGFQEMVTVWRDGWQMLALTSWAPASGGRSRRALEALHASIEADGAATLSARLEPAAAALADSLPSLSIDAARALLVGAEALALEPPRAFHDAVAAVRGGRAALPAGDAQRLDELTRALLGHVPWRRRRALESYLGAPPEGAGGAEAELLGELRSGYSRLDEADRIRLRNLWEAAILAGR